MWSFLFDKVFNTGTPNNSNNSSPPSEYAGRYRTPPSSSLNSQSFRSTNINASSQNHSGNPKSANARKRPGISTFCMQLPERGNIEINIRKNESRFGNMNIQSSAPRNPKKFENNANLRGQNYNKSKLSSQNNGEPLNYRSAHTNPNQKTNSSNSQTSFRSTNINASSQNHSGNPKNPNARKRPGISTFCMQLPERRNIEINIKKNESRFGNMNIQSSAPRNPKKFENNANLGGQNYNVQQRSSNSQTCSKTKLAPKNKQPN